MPRAAEFLVALPYRRFCGRSVQGYRLGRLAGIGGSGAVFDAVGPGGVPAALKLLRPLRPSYDLAAVWREVAPLSRVDHPAVPAWRGIVRAGRAYFIVLERMPGDSLATWLFERRHVFGPVEVAGIGSQLADALVALHEAGAAHGDLRPANILYDGERVSLIDFGLSRQEEDGAEVFAAACAADIAGFADIVLYLRYVVRLVAPGVSWRDELPLLRPAALPRGEALAGADMPGSALSAREARTRFWTHSRPGVSRNTGTAFPSRRTRSAASTFRDVGARDVSRAGLLY